MSTVRDERYWLRATNVMLEARVSGLEYELRQRDLRLAEKDRYIAQLEQRIEELKQQVASPSPVPASLPPSIKANFPSRPHNDSRPLYFNLLSFTGENGTVNSYSEYTDLLPMHYE